MNLDFKEFCAHLTWVDLVVVFALLRGVYVGIRSGFFSEALRLVTYLLTIGITFRYYKLVGEYITLSSFLNESAAAALGFVVLAVCVFLAARIIVVLLKKLLKVGEGGYFSRACGAVVGACRWVIILGLIFYLIDMFPGPLKKDIHERSAAGPTVSRIMPTLLDFMASLSPQLAVPNK